MVSLPDYERLIAPARERFAESAGVKALEAVKDDRLCELFLIYFCTLGVRMTEPVEGWIRRAAARCSDMGFSEVAGALRLHAGAEADHHLSLIADLNLLAAHWNSRRSPPVDADALLERGPSPGVAEYCRLHEDYIASATPFVQVAIEYEIEMLPLKYGELVTARCVDLLGFDVLSRLGFITQHIAYDVGHTEFNARALARLIEQAPWSLSALVTAGTSALNAYAGFLEDCMQLSEDHARKLQNRGGTPRPTLTWRLQLPPASSDDETSCSSPDWLGHVRSLRGKVLFDKGRRPAFLTSEGGFHDPDPVDPYAFHILAQDGTRLVGCVRVYPLRPGGPACLTERILGEHGFSEMLKTLDAQRTGLAEIGRWTVDPDHRTKSRDFGLGIRLAAASAALARRLQTASRRARGLVICAAGTTNRQDSMLARMGLTPVPGLEPFTCADYDDKLRIFYGCQTQLLNPHLEALIDEMAEILGLHDVFGSENPLCGDVLEDAPRDGQCWTG